MQVPDNYYADKQYLLSLLSPQRYDKAKRIKHKKSFYYCTLAELLLKKALGVLPDSKIEYYHNQNGKPYLVNHDMFFNLSHTDGYILCATDSHTPLGVDVQAHKQHIDFEKIAKRWFHNNDWQKISDQKSIGLFYDMWTAKESIVKCDGCGIQNNFSDFYLEKSQNGFKATLNSSVYNAISLNIASHISASLAINNSCLKENPDICLINVDPKSLL